MAKFNSNHKEVLDSLFSSNPSVRLGTMFGYPGYYAGKKLCICVYQDGVGVKLPEETAKSLLASDSRVVPFRPMGKPKMREWIQINPQAPEGLYDYQDVFEQSIGFLLAQQKETA